MREQERIAAGVQLLVEGNDQRNFFRAFITHLALDDIQVWNFGGVSDLGRFLRAFAIEPGFRSTVNSVGIARDAEKSAVGAFRSVQSSLEKAGLAVPEQPEILGDGSPSVRVLILPGKGHPGMLETLLCGTFANSPEDNCITGFFDCMAEAGVGEMKRPDKARAWAYLTTRPDPHHSVGYATAKGYWGDLNQPIFCGIRRFLKNLCLDSYSGGK